MGSNIEAVVRDSAKRQVVMHRVTGGIWIFLGVIFCFALFVPGKADEQGARIGAGIFGVVALASGIAFLRVMTRRVATLVELLLTRRAELKEPTLIQLRSRGMTIGYAITVRDTSGRKYRMRVASEQGARDMLAGIPS